jgi:hypothetical protein
MARSSGVRVALHGGGRRRAAACTRQRETSLVTLRRPVPLVSKDVERAIAAPILPRHRVHARRRVPEWAAQGHEGLPCREGSSGTVRQPGAMATWEYSRQGRWILLTQRAPISWRVEEYVRGSRSRLEPRGPRLSRGICQTSCAGPWSRRRRGFEPRRYRCEVLASAQGSPARGLPGNPVPRERRAGSERLSQQ